MENWKVVSGENEPVKLGVYRIHEHSIIPTFATDGSACFDMYSCMTHIKYMKVYNDNYNEPQQLLVENDSVRLHKGCRAMVPTGIIFDIPKGYSVRLHARSGLALKNGIKLVNQEAIIDSDYVLETFILLTNSSIVPFDLAHGMRICQGELVRNTSTLINETLLPPEKRERDGGFGSTGIS